MYCGCGTCCAKTTWCMSLLLLLAAAAALAAGLTFSIPGIKRLVECNPAANGKPCWDRFWQDTKAGSALGLYFFLACAGAACLLLSLLTFCCFCCQRNPRHKKRKQEQFMAGDGTTGTATTSAGGDTAVYSDQYAAYDANQPYNAYPAVDKRDVAHV